MTADRQAPPGAVLGAILVVSGLGFLALRYFEPLTGAAIWPLFIVGPGVALFVIGLVLPNVGMIIGGSVVTTVGVLLAWQSATGLWATWAYAWALVGPTASGVGTFVGGLRTSNRRLVSGGLWQIAIGLLLFVGGYLFFEQVIGLTGNKAPLPEWVFPAFLIALGVLVLLQGFFQRTWSSRGTAPVPPPPAPQPPAQQPPAQEPPPEP